MAGTGRATGRIVVGVDGSPSSEQALRWGLEQAERTGAVVVAVHAWRVSASYASATLLAASDDPAAAAERWLEETVAKAVSGSPPVQVRRRVRSGHPAAVLVDAAADADLLVVGSRGRGGFAGALLGSVGQHCIHHAPCPVVVVRGAGGSQGVRPAPPDRGTVGVDKREVSVP